MSAERLLDFIGRIASAGAAGARGRAIEDGAVLRRRQPVGQRRFERVEPERAVAVAADRQFALTARLGRRQPDLGFAVRAAAGRLRLSVRQAALRRDAAPAIYRRRVVTKPSLRGAKRRSNPALRRSAGLLRFARNDERLRRILA